MGGAFEGENQWRFPSFRGPKIRLVSITIFLVSAGAQGSLLVNLLKESEGTDRVPTGGSAVDGKRPLGDGRYAYETKCFQRRVKRGDRRRGSLWFDPGGLLPNAIYIYIYGAV